MPNLILRALLIKGQIYIKGNKVLLRENLITFKREMEVS